MKILQKSLLLAAATSIAITSPLLEAQGIKLTDELTVTGFIDMSLFLGDPDSGDSVESFGLDQFEIDFLYDFGKGLSAQVDLEYQDNGTGEEADIEQAFITYSASDELSFKAGRFLSYTGWETEEPTGLFQFSGTGYAAFFYGGYQQGVSAKYSTPTYDLGISLVNDLGDLEGEARDAGELGVEVLAAVRPAKDWVVKAFYLTDELETGETSDLINIWGSYSPGPWTFAVEYNVSENAPAAGAGVDAEGFLLMGNYAWNKWGVTLRYHEWELENAAGTTFQDMSGITLAPSYTFGDNLLFVFEFRADEDDVGSDGGDAFAIEALLTF